MSLRISDSVTIEDWEMTEQFVRASGPGGQNVNKVATAVELRFEAMRSPALTNATKMRLRHLAGRRWTSDGAVVLKVSETRSQARNREIARDRLRSLILSAMKPPRKRISTSVPTSEKRRRLGAKRMRSDVKAKRGRVAPDEE